ncbi:hypothetical protein [Spirillospora sp. CA-294931]|uniref:hypothetical protein n=1 Tax=Spirillospora sp. CA-294931 TaxID=3240042 RepID=UPI003D8C2905
MRTGRLAACVRWVITAAAVLAGAAAVITLLGGRPVVAVLLANAAIIGVGARVVRDIREQQRRILLQLEIQTRVLHAAARLAAAERQDDKRS